MPALSAGVLLHRVHDDGRAGAEIEVLIGHPGGPYWHARTTSVVGPQGRAYDSGDDPWQSAKREFLEELGLAVPTGQRRELGTVKQPSGKLLTVFAVAADLDIGEFRSNTFTLEWPRGLGRLREFPSWTGSPGCRSRRHGSKS